MPRGVVLTLTPAEVVARARSLCVVPSDPASRIYYSSKPGKNGGADPEAITCASLWRDKADGGRLWLTADCVGLAMWAYGCDRRGEAENDEMVWWNQNSVFASAKDDMNGQFAMWSFVEDPYPGCLALIRGPIAAVKDRKTGEVLIPGDKRVGHMAVVVEVADGKATRVIHCSGSGKKRHGQAIGEDPIGTAMGSRPVYFVERVR